MSFKFAPDSVLYRPEFEFGAATAAFQIEGARHRDGKSDSIWDTFCATPGKVANGDTGDIACQHYERWPEDFELISQLNLDCYRLSISWPRIIPQPDGKVNPAGLAFYREQLEALKRLGIKANVTLYHWDLPQYLEDRGGWLNRETAYKFAEYAAVVTQELGELVDSFTTFNEPLCSAFLGYRIGIHAPGVKDDRCGFQAVHHLLLAHGLALPKMRANAPHAKHGIVLNFSPAYPLKPSDEAAVVIADAEDTHWFIQPLLEGTYPELMRQLRPQWWPLILPGDLALIHQPLDFIGINYYTRRVVTSDPETLYRWVKLDDVERTAMGWEVYPEGLSDLLLALHQRYSLPPVIITENGMASDDQVIDGKVNDQQRCDYFQSHLQAVDHAVRQGVPVCAYYAWSLMDNFEWSFGYDKRFGLIHVDYQTQQRTIKQSGLQFAQFLAQRKGL
ncbi:MULTISPECIES: GH1 family beta-glucosidase [unclassified Agarivorans]|uniref:GH1 family beta-glucosidase n=1 Tax=unclassified Agarivorans TaxID=2636026 RepID=UPI003D7E111F